MISFSRIAHPNIEFFYKKQPAIQINSIIESNIVQG